MKKMILQKKLRASWTQKRRRLRLRAGEGEIDPRRANSHQGKEDAPHDGEQDCGGRERGLLDGFAVCFGAIPGQPAGKSAHCLREEDPKPVGFPRNLFHTRSPDDRVCSCPPGYAKLCAQPNLSYSVSETASSHSLEQFSPGTSNAR